MCTSCAHGSGMTDAGLGLRCRQVDTGGASIIVAEEPNGCPDPPGSCRPTHKFVMPFYTLKTQRKIDHAQSEVFHWPFGLRGGGRQLDCRGGVARLLVDARRRRAGPRHAARRQGELSYCHQRCRAGGGDKRVAHRLQYHVFEGILLDRRTWQAPPLLVVGAIPCYRDQCVRPCGGYPLVFPEGRRRVHAGRSRPDQAMYFQSSPIPTWTRSSG